MTLRVGLTLPSFVDDPEIPIAVAREAERAGVDAVFAFDHLFRTTSDGQHRPALECTALLGAIAAETEHIGIGSLVLRATLRPPATLAAALDTLRRIAGDRLVVGLGSGDSDSREEMETFGFDFGDMVSRLDALAAATRELVGRGWPVWIGGDGRHVGPVAAAADGWNRWGIGPGPFADELAIVRAGFEAAGRDPDEAVMSWGGVVVLGEDDDAARARADRLHAPPGVAVGGPATLARRLREYAHTGADWVVLGPLDASDPLNATIAGELLVPLLV